MESNNQKAAQNSDPVVVIGCGGTGAWGLHVLKDKVYKQLEPDNPGEPVPRYGHIRFLAIDCNPEEIKKTNLNNDDEFCNLYDPHLDVKFHNSANLDRMLRDRRYQWLSAGWKDAAKIEIPAGGTRQLGRYLVINEAPGLYDRIKSAINNAVWNRDSNKLVIHILAHVSGSMGSGSFLDVCYITRKVLMDMGITGASVLGYVFLPDVSRDGGRRREDNKIQSEYRNGYAALMELDYLMQLKENHDFFTQDYGDFHIHTNEPPVDVCHLVSAIDANGNVRTDGFQYCINVTADYIMAQLFRIPTNLGYFSFKGYLAGVAASLAMLPVEDGAYNRYHVLGAASAEMPMTQAATYLATGLYDKMSTLLLNAPTDQDVENFVKNTMGLTVPELRRRLSGSVKLVCQVPCPPMETVKMITQPYVHAESILRPMDGWLYAQQGQIERNYQKLNEDVRAYRYDLNAASLIGKLFNELINLCLDTGCGPTYAAMLLERNGKTISAFLQGLHTEADKQARDAKKQEDFQAEQVELAKNAFTSSRNMIWNRHVESRAYEAYRGALGIWYRRKLDTTLYQQLDKLIVNLKEKVELMNRIYFRKLKNMLYELQRTFKSNAYYFNDPRINEPVADDGYTMRIMVFSELKKHLDGVLGNEKAESAALAFTQHLIDNSEQWLSDDEYRIRRMVNDFIGNHFSVEMNMTMDDYLKEKFPGLMPWQIQQELQDLLFKPLYDRSEPLFWCSPSASVDDVYRSVSLFVPVQANNVLQSAVNYSRSVAHFSYIPYGNEDRIFMIRLYSGIPLYAYHGVPWLKKAYDDNISIPGVHLYERGEINWKERLVSPIPFSIDKTETNYYERIEKAIKEAEEIGILSFGASEYAPEDVSSAVVYQSNLLKNEELMALLKAFNAIGDNTSEWTGAMMKVIREKYFREDSRYSMEPLFDVLKQLEEYMLSIKQHENSIPLEVLCDGTSNKRAVCIDHLVRAYVLRNTLIEEVALYHSLELALERLKSMIEMISPGPERPFETFFYALVLGELHQGIGKISFLYEEGDREIEMILASRDMPMNQYLLYQAFVTFRDMDPALRDMLKEKTDEKLDNLQEGDEAIARKLYSKYNPRMVADLEKLCRRENDCKEIVSFYEALVDNLAMFLDQFE